MRGIECRPAKIVINPFYTTFVGGLILGFLIGIDGFNLSIGGSITFGLFTAIIGCFALMAHARG